MYILQKKVNGNWKTTVSSISTEKFADEWLDACRKYNPDTEFRKRID